MRLKHKVSVAVLAGTAWVGCVAVGGADVPAGSLASANSVTALSNSMSQTASGSASWIGRLDRAGAEGSAAAQATTTLPTPGAPNPAALDRPSQSQATRSGDSVRASDAKQAGYDAGGSMSGSSAVSQAYAQTTQSGWGCQAALQYLSQHANPQFQLVCPGYAMGHQAMTCYYLQGTCPNSAEIVIADPCPAAYENEAWNSWHMGTGPYDPYGWCSDWSGERGPIAPAPQPPSAGPVTPSL